MKATITRSLPLHDYLALRSVHFSTLKAIDISPLHYRRAVDFDRADTLSLRIGRAVHAMILTPNVESVAVYEGATRRGKDWKAFAAEHAGKVILKKDELEGAIKMHQAVYCNPTARALLAKGEGEVTIEWEELPGLPCRARLDWLCDDGSIVELKTARSIGPRAFARECAARCYHAQVAFYASGLGHIVDPNETTAPLPSIIAVENQPPYDVAVYRVKREALDAGRRKIDGWLKTLAACEASGKWPGIGGDGAIDLVLPAWESDGLPDVDLNGIGGEDGAEG